MSYDDALFPPGFGAVLLIPDCASALSGAWGRETWGIDVLAGVLNSYCERLNCLPRRWSELMKSCLRNEQLCRSEAVQYMLHYRVQYHNLFTAVSNFAGLVHEYPPHSKT